MKNRNQMKSPLILLCVILSTMMLVSGAMAASHMEATGACTNLKNEGVEFFVPFGASLDQADKWRDHLTAELKQTDGNTAGTVMSLELKMANSSVRYQCTDMIKNTGENFSCNSLPIGASITGVYFRVKSTAPIDSDVQLWVYPTAYAPLSTAQTDGKVLMEAWGVMKLPPYPCARNYLVPKDFVAKKGTELVYNTGECDGNKTITFEEQPDKFAMVNLIHEDTLKHKRVKVAVSPKESYSYDLVLTFEASSKTYDVTYTYDATDPDHPKTDASSLGDSLTNSDLPLTLLGGRLENVKAVKKDIWGNDLFPSRTDFDIKLWYENTAGTLGYENAVFHFERNLNIAFAPNCSADPEQINGVAVSAYDVCKDTRQPFTADLTVTYVKDGDTVTEGVKIDTGKIYPKGTYWDSETEQKDLVSYWFITRKCADSACTAVTETTAFPHSITFSDGNHQARTWVNTGTIYHKPGTASIFNMKAYGKPSAKKPFSITGVSLMADEPGTYVIYGFSPDEERKKLNIENYATKFYVTVPANDSLTSCSTLANNGYFKADWNDCLDPMLTQLMPFEHIQGTEEAWVRNTSGHGVHFPYVSEWSYTPQELTVASLTCKFEALSAGGRPGDGYCHPDDVYVPPHTKVTITGGTLYLPSIPKQDDYYVAYARRDTWNISHLFFKVYVRECKNVKKIPDTGISLRSPLKVNESVDAATSYVFTGNSLRIPAIGLGMETPIPIVHVYYADGSADNGWDLSTLGNYVGELEGGSYLPYAGNSALTGHYYSMGVFKNLEGLNMGDEVIVYGNDGVKYIYKVVQKFIAQPSDVYEMFQQVGERSLTLVTCENYNIVTDEYERRTIIRAVIDSQDLYEEGIW